MSLNDIQLKDFIVAEWYKDALLESPDGPPAIRRSATVTPASTAPAIPPAAPPTPPSPAPIETIPPAQPKPAAPQPVEPIQVQPPSAYKFLGKNLRRISILVDAKDAAFLPDDQLNFLSKILEACRMNVGDVAIVNHAVQPVNITALRGQLQPSVVLLFGIDPTNIKLPINFPEFKVQPYDDCTYLLAPSLTTMVMPNDEARLLKSKLWICLKTLFQI